jgi:uncharacterized protein
MTHSSLIQKIGLSVVVCALVGLTAFQNVWGGFKEGMDVNLQKDYATALKEFKPLAEQGNADAQFNLGLIYINGLGTPKNEEIAFKWFHKSAEQRHARAQFFLGWMYEAGFRAKKRSAGKDYPNISILDFDYGESVKWYRKSAEQGYAQAQLSLGRLYEKGNGVLENKAKAAKWYRRAGTQNHFNAFVSLRKLNEKLHRKYPGVPKDSSIGQHLLNSGRIDQGINLLIKEALLLDTKATSYMWNIYQYHIKGYPRFDPRIFRTIKLLATEGVPRSQYYLGVIYDEGLGVKANEELALQWLIKSGIKESHVSTARIYIKRGKRSKAETYLNKAAELGSAQGYYNLAIYRQMDGDYAGAKAYFEKTLEIDPNDEKAIVNLGQLYFHGRGVKQDERRGFLLFLKAARWGDSTSMVNVGSAYLAGSGVGKDLGKAYMWLSLSKSRARRKNMKEFADRLLKKAKAQMGEAEIKEVGRLVREWRPEQKKTTGPEIVRRKKMKAQESKNTRIKKKQPHKSLSKRKFIVPVWGGPAKDKALHDAAYKLDVNKVRAALKAGANPSAAKKKGRRMTPLQFTVFGWDNQKGPNSNKAAVEIVEMLFAYGAKLGIHDRDILYMPVTRGNLLFISLLIDKGASPTAKIEGYTPTELAIKYHQKAAYDLLVTRGGIPVNRQTSAQIDLVEASGNNGGFKAKALEVALKAGARINGKDPADRTALINALCGGIYTSWRAEKVRWLLEHGADPNLSSESGFRGMGDIPPLHLFVSMNRNAMNPKNDDRRRRAAKVFSESVMKMLLKAGAKVSGFDSMDRSPLHWAAKSDNFRAAQILISEGAKVMPRDRSGKTPLDYAETGRMIKLLKANGARE